MSDGSLTWTIGSPATGIKTLESSSVRNAGGAQARWDKGASAGHVLRGRRVSSRRTLPETTMPPEACTARTRFASQEANRWSDPSCGLGNGVRLSLCSSGASMQLPMQLKIRSQPFRRLDWHTFLWLAAR